MRNLAHSLIIILIMMSMAYGQHFNVSQSFGTTKVIAGLGDPSFSGDGGLATEAGLKNPRDIAVDSNGNLYIADTGNQVIRKVDAQTGVITTIVGNGERGFSDDGVAVNMKLDTPEFLAVDNDDNVVFVDKGNFSIRRLNQNTGLVETLFKELNKDLGAVLVDGENRVYFLEVTDTNVYQSEGEFAQRAILYRLTSSGSAVRIYPENDDAPFYAKPRVHNIALDNFGNILIVGENIVYSPLTNTVIDTLEIPKTMLGISTLINTSTVAVDGDGKLYFASNIVAPDFGHPASTELQYEYYLTVYEKGTKQLGGGFTEPEYTRITDWTSVNYGQAGVSDYYFPFGRISIPKIITDKNGNILMVFLKEGIHQIKRVTVGTAYEPSIKFSLSEIDFGQVQLGETKSMDLSISNDGNMKLLVPKITSKNSYVKIDVGTLALNEGDKTNISVTFNAQDKTPINSTLTILSNDPDSSVVELPIKAKPIFGTIKSTQSEIDFKNVLVNGQTSRILKIVNEGAGSLTLNSATFQDDRFNANIDSIVIGSGASQEIQINFQPDSQNSVNAELTIESNDPDNPSIKIPLSGNGVIPGVTVDLDDDESDSQKYLQKGLKAGDAISVQLFGNGMPELNGFSAVLSFNGEHLGVAEQGFVAGDFLSGALPLVTSTDSTLVANIASTGGASTATDALLGTANFVLKEAFSDSAQITLNTITFSAQGGFVSADLNLVVVLSAESALIGDFNGNGSVDFPDFIAFAQNFGKTKDSSDFDKSFDMNENGTVDFPDFLTFASQFGKTSE